MTQVTIRANLPVLGLRSGQETDVEYTPLIKAIAASGKISLLSEPPADVDDTPPPAEPQPDDAGTVGLRQDGYLLNEVPGEFDATHGEADPPPAE